MELYIAVVLCSIVVFLGLGVLGTMQNRLRKLEKTVEKLIGVAEKQADISSRNSNVLCIVVSAFLGVWADTSTSTDPGPDSDKPEGFADANPYTFANGYANGDPDPGPHDTAPLPSDGSDEHSTEVGGSGQ